MGVPIDQGLLFCNMPSVLREAILECNYTVICANQIYDYFVWRGDVLWQVTITHVFMVLYRYHIKFSLGSTSAHTWPINRVFCFGLEALGLTFCSVLTLCFGAHMYLQHRRASVDPRV